MRGDKIPIVQKLLVQTLIRCSRIMLNQNPNHRFTEQLCTCATAWVPSLWSAVGQPLSIRPFQHCLKIQTIIRSFGSSSTHTPGSADCCTCCNCTQLFPAFRAEREPDRKWKPRGDQDQGQSASKPLYSVHTQLAEYTNSYEKAVSGCKQAAVVRLPMQKALFSITVPVVSCLACSQPKPSRLPLGILHRS